MSQVVLTGSLGFLSLGDILQLVGSNGGTGVLRVISKYAPEPGLIYFSKGNITNASAASLKGLDAAYSLFGWIEGEFEFSEEEFSVKKKITTNRMEIILDGLRMVDEGIVPILGPVSFEKKSSDADKTSSIPVIKGPLVDYMYVVDEEEFRQGQTIVRESSHGNWIWVILEGVVDIVKETAQGPLTMLRIADGAFIGSLASFLFQGTLRSATAVAMTDVQLGVLDSQRLSNDYAERSREFRTLAMSLDKRLKEVNTRTVEIYLKQDRVKEFTKGKKIFKIGQGKKKGNNLFIIRKGSASVIRKTKTGYVPLVNIGADDFLGHVPFLDIGHEPDNASVFVSEDFEADELDGGALQEEYNQLSPTLKNMIENIATCVSITTSTACSFQKKSVQKK